MSDGRSRLETSAQTPELPAEAGTPARAYHAPRLRDFGSVRDVTNTSGAPGGNFDSVTYIS